MAGESENHERAKKASAQVHVKLVPPQYRVGLLFLALGLCLYVAIHIYHFRSRTEQRMEVASFGLIGFGLGQLSYAWHLNKRK